MFFRLAVVLALVMVFAAMPAFANCKVCDGNGCKNAAANESGRSDCTATTTSCTISGSTCFSGGGECECGTMGCGPCNGTCFETPWQTDEWELASVQIIPARAAEPEWVLVDVRATPAIPVR